MGGGGRGRGEASFLHGGGKKWAWRKERRRRKRRRGKKTDGNADTPVDVLENVRKGKLEVGATVPGEERRVPTHKRGSEKQNAALNVKDDSGVDQMSHAFPAHEGIAVKALNQLKPGTERCTASPRFPSSCCNLAASERHEEEENMTKRGRT